jgi:hypothetical protein
MIHEESSSTETAPTAKASSLIMRNLERYASEILPAMKRQPAPSAPKLK